MHYYMYVCLTAQLHAAYKMHKSVYHLLQKINKY